MSRFLVAIHHPHDYDGSQESAEMHRDIDALNDEMVAAGIRVFVGGLHPPAEARAIRRSAGGDLIVTDGPYVEAREHVGGFWVLEVRDLEEAIAWGHKAATACRAPVEVRQFH